MKNGKNNKKTRGTGKNAFYQYEALTQVLTALNKVKAQYLVIGGIACNLHGIVRATKDIDLLIPKDLKNTEKILAVLADLLLWGMAEELDAKKVIEKPFTIIGDQPRVDLMTVAGTLNFEEAKKTAIKKKVGRTTVLCADINSLLKMKNTNRPQDLADSIQLRELKAKTKIQ